MSKINASAAPHWLSKPEKHDYPAAQSYLNLIFDDKTTEQLVKKLKNAPITHFKSKDVFRASGLAMLGSDNAHVKADAAKVAQHVALSPILLVRHSALGKVMIADGYHRMCAMYNVNEDALIPCQIVTF